MFAFEKTAWRLRVLVVVGTLTVGCPPKEKPTDQKSCAASNGCREEGKCTWDLRRSGCVVGSHADCQNAVVCGKEGRCKKVGDTCEKGGE